MTPEILTITMTKGFYMAAGWKDTTPRIAGIDNAGMISFEIGPEGFQMEVAELQEKASGLNTLDALKLNMAISLALAGVDFTDEIAVKEHIESKTFKYFR
jgi:hypothetical protein